MGTILGDIDILEVLEGIPHGAALMDGGLRLVAMNSLLEVLTGYDSGEVGGLPARHIIRSNMGGRDRPWQDVLEKAEAAAIEGDIITAQRKKLPVRFSLRPLKDGSGAVAGVLAVIEDISLLKDAGSKGGKGGKPQGLLGNSPRMQEIFELLPIFASTDATLLITGNTGTGKDLLAETIHNASRRSSYPFIKVNCGALPDSLLESELFGHVRGAFTGAHADKPGMFRLAQGGTIYLTEIGDLPLPLQVKLLTVLDDREFFPVGAARKVSVDVRIMTGTHHDLRRLVREGRFREDLFFRLNVLRAHLPPLCQRDGDMRLLINHFLGVFSKKLQKPVTGFGREALEMLEAYRYPGNVRELINIVEYAVNICRGSRIEPEHLPPLVCQPPAGTPDRPEPSDAGRQGPEQPTATSWTEMEKKQILEALFKAGGHRGKAARALGWGRSTLWRKIKHYGLQ